MLKSEWVVRKLIRENRSISTMESCTSGLIASMITNTEGASAIYPGGYVTYANQVKVQAGVSADVIRRYGVYSPECARAMAQTVQKNLRTEIAIGITGTTGNVDPNNGDSVQGEAYFCICIGNEIYDGRIRQDVSAMTRAQIKQLYAEHVFDALYDLLYAINN